MQKLKDYTDRCGSCIHYKRMIKDGQVQEHGGCYIKGRLIYHNSSQKKCKKYVKDENTGTHITLQRGIDHDEI